MESSSNPPPALLTPLASARGLLALVGLLAACQGPGSSGSTGLLRSADKPRAERDCPIDVEHYELDLVLDPDTRSFEATCGVRLLARDRDLIDVELDFAGLSVQHVLDAQGRELHYEQKEGRLRIDLPEPQRKGETAEYTISYGGVPRKGLWFSGDVGGKPTQVFTQGECQDARWWFPCIDEPWERATSELRVSMPSGWTSVAAGQRIEHSESPGRVVERWKMDFAHPAYLTTLVAGEFTVQTGEWDGIPLQYLASPSEAPLLARSFEETDDVLAFLSDLSGVRYPYAKYAQSAVQNFPFGGMENISATTLTELALVDERGARDGGMEGLIAHEAAHQWYGDLLTCADWSHAWLNEGVATYATQLYYESSRGVDEFRARMRDMQRGYVAADIGNDRRPTVWSVYRDPLDLFFKGGQTYGGAACRLHLLRLVLGEQGFFDGLRTYTAENQGRSVSTRTFQRAMEKVSGADLGWFFEQWFYKAGYPEFRVSWNWSAKKGAVELQVEQVQRVDNGTPLCFRTPVLVEVRDESGPALHRLQLDKRRQTFELPAARRPLYISFDKYSWIPKKLEQRRGSGEWLAMLRLDDDVNGRRDAASALGELAAGTHEPAEVELWLAELTDRMHKDSCAAVREAAATALGRARGLRARDELRIAACGDASAHVRAAALRALGGFGPDAGLAAFGRQQFEASWSWGTMAAAAELVCHADPEQSYGWLSKALLCESPHDKLRADLLGTLGQLGGEAARDQLLRWAGDTSAGTAARAAAVAQLAGRAKDDLAISRGLLPLLASSEYRLRAAAINALAEARDPQSQRALRSYYPSSVDPRERRAIEAALAAGD